MRRALGLTDAPPAKPDTPPPSGPTHTGVPRPPRRFVRDGDVEVTLVHRDRGHDAGGNQLDAARQAIRSQAAARERAEHLLEEARNTIRDLQTKLAHERLAKDEIVRRIEAEKQSTEQALEAARAEVASERATRRKTEEAFAEATKARQVAEALLKEANSRRQVRQSPEAEPEPAAEPEAEAKPVRRRGRPPKVRTPEPAAEVEVEGEGDTEFVEWWKPGWRERLR